MSGLAAEEEARLLAIALASVEHGLRHGRALVFDAALEPPALRALGASFVTLRTSVGTLRGCVGTLEPERALAEDVADNAFRAAFHDPRFAPVVEHEVASLALSISILGAPERIEAATAQEVAARLRPGLDGLILRQGARRATFLPEVWESFREPLAFVRALAGKAGIASWRTPVEAFRYGTTTLGGRSAGRAGTGDGSAEAEYRDREIRLEQMARGSEGSHAHVECNDQQHESQRFHRDPPSGS